MVSSACRGSCTTMPSKANTRILNIDRRKDYTVPLQVETSVEYDLPSHIYPPKGSEPILMIHPAFTTPARARRVSVTSHSPVVLTNSSSAKPLSALLVHNNQPEVKNTSKSTQPTRCWCSCGNPNCSYSVSNSTRVGSVRNSSQPSSVLTSRQLSDNFIYSAVKNSQQSTEVKSPQTQKQLQQKAQLQEQKAQLQRQHKAQLQQQKAQLQQQQNAQLQQQNAQLQKQIHQQKQLQIQQQHLQQVQLQQQLQERAKLQAQQLQQLQQAQKQKVQQSSTLPRQQSSTADQLMVWSSSGNRCQGPCCQPRLGALVPSQVEFLAPGLPPSLLARTPTRGQSGGSPKLRARTRRGLSVANTINLPEYLGSARSSRTSSVGGIVGGSSHVRTRSSSMLAATPAPITAHQVASALDVVRAHALTPRTLLASTTQQLQSNLSNTSSLLSTVGQSRDSGCSLSAEGNVLVSASNFTNNENALNNKTVEWTWNVVDSGFCTPVDNCDDQIMEPFDMNILGTYTPVAQPSAHNNSNNSSTTASNTSFKESARVVNNLSWMRDFASPLTSTSIGGLQNTFLPPTNPHYIPQPIWNLAY